MEATLMKTV